MTEITPFFALMSRMRYIGRWGLMRSSIPENVQEHTCETAMFAHALGIIRRDIFHRECDAEHLSVLALYHDASEILTGDLPTPIKYHDTRIRTAYKDVERIATERILSLLPEALRDTYTDALNPEGEEERLIKAADKLSALVKCMEERKTGNREFASAEEQTRQSLIKMQIPEVDWFMEHCLPAFENNLDELGTMN